MSQMVRKTQMQKLYVVNLLQHMKFPAPINFQSFEEAVEVINIKNAANRQMAMESMSKKKGKMPSLKNKTVTKTSVSYAIPKIRDEDMEKMEKRDLQGSGSSSDVALAVEEKEDLFEFG